MKLSRLKSKPGSAVQRFGDWRTGEPSVLVDNWRWQQLGKPDEVHVSFGVPDLFPVHHGLQRASEDD